MLINVQSQLLTTVDSIHDIEKELRHVAHAQLTERHGTYLLFFFYFYFKLLFISLIWNMLPHLFRWW
jgi:hypothetical protein